MARRHKKRRRFGAHKKAAPDACALNSPEARYMKWLNKHRTGSLDKKYLRLARQGARGSSKPGAKTSSLARTIHADALKLRFKCFLGKEAPRKCKELTSLTAGGINFNHVAACYLSRIAR